MKLNSLESLLEVSISHNPEIKKKVLVEKGEIPHLTQFARAVFKPGQIANSPIHPDMSELFYIESGEGEALINDQKYPLKPGDCLTVDPGEDHIITNSGKEDLVIWMLGVEN